MSSADEIEDTRVRLKRFYEFYGVPKTEEEIQKALDRFNGNYPKMWTMIEAKYGPESAAANNNSNNNNNNNNNNLSAVPSSAEPAVSASLEQQQQQQHDQSQSAGGAALSSPSPSSTENVENIRSRLIRYYKYYCAQKTQEDVETAMVTFANGKKGGYEAMFARLESKYGPEKNIPEHASITLSHEEQIVAAKLVAYYRHYGVTKNDADIKTAILKFRNGSNGGFNKMFEKLVEKYGPIPDSVSGTNFTPSGDGTASFSTDAASRNNTNNSSGQQNSAFEEQKALQKQREAPREDFDASMEDPASKLRRFYDCHAPTKTDDEIRQSLDKFIGPTASASGGEKALWQKLSDKYGAMPLPPPGYASQWNRLRKFFNHFTGTRTRNSEIDWMLAKANSTPMGIPQMWQDLIAKHGPEPLDPEIARAMKGPFAVTSRQIGDGSLPPSLTMNTSMPRAHGELFRRPKPRDSTATGGASGAAESVRLLINFAGLDYTTMEDLPLDKRRIVADAMEQQVANNAGLQARNVALIDYKGADAEFELTAASGSEHHLFHAAASLVPRTLQGCFSVKILRDALLKECRINPLHIHAIAAKIVKNVHHTKGHNISTRPPIVDAAASNREISAHPPSAPQLTITEAEAKQIRIADEVEKMSEQQRMQYSWKKSLEERLNGKAGTGLSFKRNNDAFREFMGNIWTETAAAFGKDGTRSQSSANNNNNNQQQQQQQQNDTAPKNPIPGK